MDQLKRLRLNTLTSTINRIVILASGLILPRLILLHYGSEINGLTSSINQFLSVITFLDLGVGAVVQSALYKPLAKNNEKQISLILASARTYFKKIALILILYVITLAMFFPLVIQEQVDFLSTLFLILAMSINLFAQYYFGIVNELLLNASQKAYIQLSTEIILVILNTIVSVLLINNGFSIVVVKLCTGLIYLVRPVFLKYYVNKNYKIDYSIEVFKEPLEQKWNGVAQHIAAVVLNSTDVVILSIFSSLENVSIYSVYNLVVTGIKMLVTSLVTGIQSFFGNLLANEETELLDSYFTKIEWLMHTAVVYLFSLTATLIPSFVLLYTRGVTDANYYAPVFSLILVLAQALYCIRLPYNSIVLAAGHYRETQRSAVIEVVINIVISITTVVQYGLIGVAVGTFCAMAYRTVYLAVYLSRNILFRPIENFIKHLFVDAMSFAAMMMIASLINLKVENYFQWILLAVILGIIFLLIILIINFLMYRSILSYYLKRFFRIHLRQ